MKELTDKEILELAEFAGDFKVKKVSSNTYTALDKVRKTELSMYLKSDRMFSRDIFANRNGIIAKGSGNELLIKIPIYKGELKYFYASYSDYYYIPSEDYALHKSIAELVDSSLKQKAKADNCYTRKESAYLPMWEVIAEPLYKENYKSKDMYFEITNELKKDQSFFKMYAEHVINMLIK